MAVCNPYLNFNGNTEEAFLFYQSVFGGDFAMLMRFEDSPESDKVPEADKNKIMHIALPLGKGNVLMGTDASSNMPPVTFGTNFSICISADSEEDARHFFSGLSAGGNVLVPLEKMFWGDLWGMLADKFGVHWMMTYSFNQPPQTNM